MKAYRYLALAAALTIATGGAVAKPMRMSQVSTPEAADKMIVITPTTKSINVFAGDTVLFKVGDRQFAIKFDGNSMNYDLSTLAPPGVLNHKVRVHVAPNPMSRR